MDTKVIKHQDNNGFEARVEYINNKTAKVFYNTPAQDDGYPESETITIKKTNDAGWVEVEVYQDGKGRYSESYDVKRFGTYWLIDGFVGGENVVRATRVSCDNPKPFAENEIEAVIFGWFDSLS